MSQPDILATVPALRARVREWRASGQRIALVPTMGALHSGHVSLVELARQHADRVIVSIFVNPSQFAQHEDFSRYPRPFSADLVKLGNVGTDAVFHPEVAEMYPPGFCTSINLGGPAETGLEDRFRPTHFCGVATVVAKLLLQADPDVAVFGEKDFQQLAVIRQLVRDLDLPVEIVGGPTLREADGLAMSSRNVYLSPAERNIAPDLHQALQTTAQAIQAGTAIEAALGFARQTLTNAGFILDYLELRDSVTLAPVTKFEDQPLRLLVAARLGTTRLIDNIPVNHDILDNAQSV